MSYSDYLGDVPDLMTVTALLTTVKQEASMIATARTKVLESAELMSDTKWQAHSLEAETVGIHHPPDKVVLYPAYGFDPTNRYLSEFLHSLNA